LSIFHNYALNGIFSIFKTLFQKGLKDVGDDGDLQETAGKALGNLVEGAADKVGGETIRNGFADILSGTIVSKQQLAQALKEYNPHEKDSAMKLVSQLASFNQDTIDEALQETDLITSQKNSIKNAIAKYLQENKDNDHALAGFWDDFADETTEEGVEKIAEFYKELGVLDGELDDVNEGASIFAAAGQKVKTAWTDAAKALGMTGAQLGILAGALIAVGIGIAVFNKLNVKVSEIDAEIDSLNSKISDLKNQIKELEEIGYRNDYENNRLKVLREELAIQEKLLSIENKRRAEELTEDSWTAPFDSGNLGTKLAYELQGHREESDNKFADVINTFKYGLPAWTYQGKLKNYLKDYNSQQQKRNALSYSEKDIEKASKILDKQDKTTEKITEILIELEDKNIQYLEAIDELKKVIESPDASDVAKERAKKMLGEYEKAQQDLQEVIVNAQKNIGAYKYDAEISGTLDNFEGVREKLVEVFEQGELTEEMIKKIFDDPRNNGYDIAKYFSEDVVNALKAAGINAEEFYKWLQNITDPKKIWKDQTKENLLSDLDPTHGYSSSYDRRPYIEQALKDAGIDLDNEVHLQAYLDVKMAAGEKSNYWGTDKWIDEIQKQLDQNKLEVVAESPSLKDIMARSTGKDESDKDKIFGDDIDNYNSKISTLEGYLDKLQDGTYTDTDLLELGKEFGITGASVDQLKYRISELGKEEFVNLNKQIEEYKKEAEENGNLELVKDLERIQEAAKALQDQMLETNDVLKQNRNVRSDVWGSKAGMDQLSAIYKDIKDGGEFDWSSIVNNNEFRENFKRFGSEYEEFVNGVFAHPKDIKANQKAFDKLADSYLKAENVLDGLNEAEKVQTKRLLDSIGVTNSAEMIQAELTSQQIDQAIKEIEAKRQVAEENARLTVSSQYLDDAIEDTYKAEEKEILALFQMGGALQNATQAQKAYYVEKTLLKDFDFISSDFKQLDVIIKALGLGEGAWKDYYESRAGYDAKAVKLTADLKAGKIDTATFEAQMSAERQKLLGSATKWTGEMHNLAEEYLFGGDPADAGTEVADAYLEAFEKELSALQGLRDAGILSEKEYLDRLQQLYIKYFANKKKYYEQFKKYEKEYLEGIKSLYESAISAAITILNDQKDDIEKTKEKTIKSLEEQRDAEKKVIQERLDKLNDEKEALEEANAERERAINLQKALYELERANSQRQRLIYKNGQMQYVNDASEIREARKNVEDAMHEQQVAKLDKEIDDLNKQLEEVDKKYEKIIEDTEKFYDKQIEEVQKLIDMWEKLQHQAELAEAYEALSQFGITAEEILSGNLEKFNLIKDGFTGVLAGLSQDVDSVAKAFGVTTEQALMFKDALLGYDDSTKAFSEMSVQLDNVGWAAEKAAKAIGDDNDDQTPSEGISAVTATKNLQTAVDGFSQSAIDKFNEWHSTITSCTEDLKALAEQVNKMNMPKYDPNGFKLNTTLSGSDEFTGTAFVNGNWSAKSKGAAGVALTGELGQELVVDSRTGNWHTVGDDGAEFAQIKPNDIVFNHKQTEELFKNGKINSRGKAYASGNNNKFTALSSEELSRYNKLDFTKDLAEKLDFGNQKLMNIDKTVATICNTKTINNSPVFNIDNTFTCNGVNLADVQNELAKAFQGIFESAYQKAMTPRK